MKVHHPVHSIGRARQALAQAFREAGLETPELDARVIVGHALGLAHSAMAMQADRAIRKHEAEHIGALAARRLAREPVARIIGYKEFWSLPLVVTPAVLVPRPESETLIEAALCVLQPAGRPKLRIADLGTGSGALLVALLHELDGAFGVGTDASPAALEVARENCARLGLAGRAAFVNCDFGGALNGGFDLVVANPPYIADREWSGLEPEVRDHDPKLALHGGCSGLANYRRIAADAGRLLAPQAYLVVELGVGMADAVGQLFLGAGLVTCGTRPDLNGIPRALMVRRAR